MREFRPVEFTVVQPLELPPDYPRDVTNLSQVYVVGTRTHDEDIWSIAAVQHHQLEEKEPQPKLGLIETVTPCDQEAAFDTSVKWIDESGISDWTPEMSSLTNVYPVNVVKNLMFGRFLIQAARSTRETTTASSQQSRSARVAKQAGLGVLNRLLHP